VLLLRCLPTAYPLYSYLLLCFSLLLLSLCLPAHYLSIAVITQYYCLS
jgi:hypothetical protein